MSLSTSIRMIPRYHWEYGLVDMWKAAFGANKPAESQLSSFGELYRGPFYFTTSGRVSLYTILRSLNLPAGARVGVPLFCCPVVFDAVQQAGCTPEFIDITDDTYTISPSHLEEKRDKLSAVVAVHMFGHPADMDAVMAAAGDIPVIEDCAQALFSTYKGRLVGTIGATSFFSFRSGKYVSAGEGSAILCNTTAFSNAIQTMVESFPSWRFHQSVLHALATYIKTTMYNRPWYGTVGQPLGSKLDRSLNLTAKSGFTMRQISPGDFRIMNDRLRSFRPRVQKQREYAHHLLGALRLKNAVLPREKPGCESNYYQFAIRLGDQGLRDRLAAHARESGIDAAKYLDGIGLESASLYGYAGDCPVAERCAGTVVTVPAYYSLSWDDIARLVHSINSFPG
jgi:dTDP-4-amino-4,6-dideoxygalactose transaminase